MTEVIGKPTNPIGANGTGISDPREEVMWEHYVQSIREKKASAYKSAVFAGYTDDYSRNITMQKWFKERYRKLKRKSMLSKAEKVLSKTLDYDPNNGGDKIDNGLLKTQTDVAKFIAGTQGKEEGYGNMPIVNDNNIVMIVLNK